MLIRRLTVVSVLYNSADVIQGCLASIPPGLEVILVDNASTDDGVQRAQATRPDAEVIRSDRNLGFGAGCNVGWRAAAKPYVAFINPDVRLHSTTLAVLLHRLADEKHGMVGPVLLDESGMPRRCKRRPSALLDLCGLLPAAGRWGPAGWDGKLDREDEVHTVGGAVACVEGACFVVSASDLKAIGGFDEDFFLYYEEESLAYRLARLGATAIYEPRAVAEHAGATSTREVGSFAVYHFHRSRVIFYRKRDGSFRGVLTALLLIFGVVVCAPSSALNTLLGRRRPTTLPHLWHVLRGLVAGMTTILRSDVSY